MGRLRYLGLRILQSIFLIWIAVSVIWVMFRLMPGDYTSMMLHDGASPEAIEAFEERWGLNEPLYIQYWEFLTSLVMLDAGTSLRFNIPVWDYLKIRLFNSIILVAPAITATYLIGAALGTLAGVREGSKFEKHGITPFIATGTVPSFFTGIMLIIVFAGLLSWFPTGGMGTVGIRTGDASFWSRYLSFDFLWHYTLPFVAVILRYTFLPLLIMRTSVVEVLGQDFIQYNKVTGLPRLTRVKKIARHASLPIITLYPISMTRALSGLVLIEFVFNWPGIGFALVQAVLDRDFPVAQFGFILVAVFIIVANVIVDIVYGIVDPRVSVDE